MTSARGQICITTNRAGLSRLSFSQLHGFVVGKMKVSSDCDNCCGFLIILNMFCVQVTWSMPCESNSRAPLRKSTDLFADILHTFGPVDSAHVANQIYIYIYIYSIQSVLNLIIS